MEYINIGTAGHVDHGKTRLVMALTGRDTDSLKEEKERGISIQLGFAPLSLPSGRKGAIVDVPGHERFIKTMVSGAAGIDMVLFLVAADEGIKPQTKEHLEILTLLGVKEGIVIISKADLVDEEGLYLAKEEISRLLKGSFLNKAKIISVSAQTGRGIEELLLAIDEIAGRIPSRCVTGRPRLATDRVFTASGFGTVVTGTLWQGTLKSGQKVEIVSPKGQKEARVRFLEVHGERREEAFAGQRTALNLAGVEKDVICKGCWVAEAGLLSPRWRLNAEIRLLPESKSLKEGESLHLYHGTQQALARIHFIDREALLKGEACLCQIEMDQPLAALRNDKFILRSFSPLKTIGGGRVIGIGALRYKKHQIDALNRLKLEADDAPLDLILTGLKDKPLTEEKIALLSGQSREECQLLLDELREQKRIVILGQGTGKLYISAEGFHNIRAKGEMELREYHKRFPLRQGVPREELRSKIMPYLSPAIWQKVLSLWLGEGSFEEKAGLLRLPGIEPIINKRQKIWREKAEALYLEKPFSPPSYCEVAQRLGIAPKDKEEICLWFLSAFLINTGGDIYFHQKAIEKAKKILWQTYGLEKSFTLGEARNLLNTSRKYALPLMEYLDRTGFTIRQGEARRICLRFSEK